MPKLHIGTSGWSYNHWKGLFYPQKIAGSDMLSCYAQQFTTVEINATFYRLPYSKTVLTWKQSVPQNFLFAVKASRYITHQKKLKDPDQSIQNFLKRIHLLDKKLGPILFHLPPHWQKNEARLVGFLDVLPTSYQYAFEFRDYSWFDRNILEQLEQRNMAFCIYDLEGKESPLHVTSDVVYVRLHGPGAAYQGSYTHDHLKKWANRFERWLAEGKEIYCYFNNDYEGQAPQNAILLKQIMSFIAK